jgi:hypothetical protein
MMRDSTELKTKYKAQRTRRARTPAWSMAGQKLASNPASAGGISGQQGLQCLVQRAMVKGKTERGGPGRQHPLPAEQQYRALAQQPASSSGAGAAKAGGPVQRARERWR